MTSRPPCSQRRGQAPVLRSGRPRDREAVFQHLEPGDLSAEIIRMVAKAVSMILPVAETFEARAPRMTARFSSAMTAWTSKRTGWVRRRRSRKKSETALRPACRPIQGSAPTSPAMSSSTSCRKSAAISSGSAPRPIQARSYWAMSAFSSRLTAVLLGKACFRDLHLLLVVVGNGSQPRTPFIFLSLGGEVR
jgi:hypothetical protein